MLERQKPLGEIRLGAHETEDWYRYTEGNGGGFRYKVHSEPNFFAGPLFPRDVKFIAQLKDYSFDLDRFNKLISCLIFHNPVLKKACEQVDTSIEILNGGYITFELREVAEPVDISFLMGAFVMALAATGESTE